MLPDNFIIIPFTLKNLDRYQVRTRIFKALNEILPDLRGKLLDIGCGKMPYRHYILDNSKVEKYIGLDIEGALQYDTDIKPDFTWDGKKMPFENNMFDCTFATEVLEHCPDPLSVTKEIYRVLKPGGIFFFTVPFLWNLHEVPHDEYRYTPFALKRIFKESGFSEIKISSLGGWHAALAQMLGMWVRRSPMKKKKRELLSFMLKPIIQYLIKKDVSLNKEFYEGQMITGLYGICKK